MSDQEDLWGEDQEPFNDRPEETKLDHNNQPLASPPARLQRPQAPVPPLPVKSLPTEEEIKEETQSEEEDDYSEVLNDASLRLEQGTLYKMIMNHNLFEGVDADPKAIQNVQNEMRKFARERMEIMLGMRRETSVVEHLEINFPFNALEVEILKKLAFAATKGATEHSDNYVPEIMRTTAEIPNIPRKTLNPISKPVKKAPQSKPLQSKPQAPVKRTKIDSTIDQIAREEGVPRELLEEGVPGVGGKPIHEMTETEIIERNRITSKRLGKQVKSASAIPMATPQQEEMLAQAHASQIGQSAGMSVLLNAVKNMPVKKQ